MNQKPWELRGNRLFTSERGLTLEEMQALEAALPGLRETLGMTERARLERYCREMEAELAMHRETLAREKLAGETG